MKVGDKVTCTHCGFEGILGKTVEPIIVCSQEDIARVQKDKQAKVTIKSIGFKCLNCKEEVWPT